MSIRAPAKVVQSIAKNAVDVEVPVFAIVFAFGCADGAGVTAGVGAAALS